MTSELGWGQVDERNPSLGWGRVTNLWWEGEPDHALGVH